MAFDYAILDVFTDRALGGNPLAVVMDADKLSDAQMQALAAEFNLSETVFVCEPLHPAHSAALRIFTPVRELPFAGHPTVGAAAYIAQRKFDGFTGTQNAMLILEEKVGLVRVGVTLHESEPPYALIDVPRASEKVEGALDKSAIAAALGLSPMEIGFENHVPCAWSSGVPFVFVPVRNLATLAKAKPVPSHWDDAFQHVAPDVYLYTRETEAFGHDFAARMFAPAMGIAEDPATGSAAAAFSGLIMHFDAPSDGDHKLVIEQGFEMGRPSLIDLVLDVRARKLKSTHIGGRAVLLAEGRLHIEGERGR